MLFGRLGRLVSNFTADRRGNVAMIFGLCAIPLFGLIGAAVDYTNAVRIRQQLQETLDAAALAGARSVGRPDAEIRAIATNFARANMPPALAGTLVTVDILNDGTTVRVTPTAPVRLATALLPVIGINSIDVSAAAEATNGILDLEIVLALDNTGSMSGSKISILRSAVTNFINSMETYAVGTGRPNAVKIGIVPFDRMVNMGAVGVGQPWVDYTLRGGSAGWNGCVTDRNQPHDVTDTTPSVGSPATWFYAANCSLEPVARLSTDWNALRGTASRMRAAGNTNVTIGLVHGYHMLTNGAPYTDAVAPHSRLQKVLIMLTDGDNTQNRWTYSSGAIDTRTRQICDNLRGASIQVYTIRVVNGNQSLLQGCATQPGMYYNVTVPEQMEPVFQDIARRLSALRLSS